MDLQCDQLSARFGTRLAIRSLSLSLPFPSRLHVRGGAGAGKSTLLKLLAGLVSPTSGRVLWDGRDVAKLSRTEKKAAQARIGMIFQSDALFDAQTVRENVSLPLLRRGVDRAEANRLVDAVLAAVGLTTAADASTQELSGGMKKRVGIARAVVAGPKVLLADAPFAGLDPATSHQIARLLAQVSLGRTLIVVGDTAPALLQLSRAVTLAEGALLEVSEQRASGGPLP